MNHADEVWKGYRFFSKLANDYLNTSEPDPRYLVKIMGIAADYHKKWEEYLKHVGKS